DGIRDATVTGVQTCALPIFLDVTATGPVDERTGLMLAVDRLDRLVQDHVLAHFHHRNINLDLPEFTNVVPTTENIVLVVTDFIRSEERRVGKECRCRWSTSY